MDETNLKIQVNGSLHSHGCWTDHRNPEEQEKFPFNLESFARLCLEIGRGFQVISEVKDHPSESPHWWNEKRYKDLIATANLHSKEYEAKIENQITTIHFRKPAYQHLTSSKLVIIRGQEVVLDDPHKHVSAIKVDGDLKGGKSAREILKEIREEGGYAIANHPFMADAWSEEELIEFYQEGLIQAIEWNGKLTFPWVADAFFRAVGKRTPAKGCNKRVLQLEDRIPIIANDDADSENDMRNGAYTSYNLEQEKDIIEAIFGAIKSRDFRRVERYNSFLSPLKHLFYIRQSEKNYHKKKKNGEQN